MNPLSEFIDALGLAGPWTYIAIFLASSLLMIWRLEALLEHGLEGTALGTLVMPYCSGLGNLLFVAIAATRKTPGQEVLTNCLVNNATNLTLVLGLPALAWGLDLKPKASAGKSTGKRKSSAADNAQRLNRLTLLLTLAAALFFSAVAWALGRDGTIDRSDGLVLVGLFLFWQCFQVFDVLKHNVRRQRSFGPRFYLNLPVVLAGAYGLYVSIDWLISWLSVQESGFVSAEHLGWLSGWLMVVPNALLAFYYAATRRADIVYASQVGDGHICIPLAIGISATLRPIPVNSFFIWGLAVVAGATIVHGLSLIFAGGLPRWMGWLLIAAYVWFVAAGLG